MKTIKIKIHSFEEIEKNLTEHNRCIECDALFTIGMEKFCGLEVLMETNSKADIQVNYNVGEYMFCQHWLDTKKV